MILPIHKLLDEINETSRGKKELGTTKKGIGPAYEDKVGRRAIRICDLKDPIFLKQKIDNLYEFHKDKIEKHIHKITHNYYEELLSMSNYLNSFSVPLWKIINELGQKNKNIVFEGAQGSMLDIDFVRKLWIKKSVLCDFREAVGVALDRKTGRWRRKSL